MSLDEVVYERTIYGFLDLLSDVGGLQDILLRAGAYISAFLTLITGSGMNRLLISSIFKLNTVSYTNAIRDPKAMTREAVREIETRVPFQPSLCRWFT